MADPKDWASIGMMRRSEASSRERGLAKDRDAYRRLRAEGLQPRALDGAAALEAGAHERFEVEMGHLFKTPDERRRATEGMALAKEWNESQSQKADD